MFSKLKEKVKVRLIKFLEIDKMINGYERQFKTTNIRIRNCENKISEQQNQIDSLRRTLEEVVKVGGRC